MTTSTSKNSVRNNQVINDFGQKIGGAHKDRAREAAELLAGVEASALLSKPLSKVAKLPDLRGLYQAGAISADVARLAWYYWSQIGTKPGASWPKRLQRWADRAAGIIAEVSRILSYALAEKSQIDNFLSLDKAAQTWDLFNEEMNAANWPADEYKRGSYFVGRSWTNEERYSIHTEKASYYSFHATVADAVAAIRAKVGEAATKGAVKFSVYHAGGVYFIAPDGKPGIKLFEYSNREEAFSAYYGDREKLEARYNELRTFPSERRDWNRPRVGEDWRQGRDMSPESFAEVFPFRGVEFGNWVNQLERAACLNEAADALQDLAAVIGVRPEALTLGGSLAWAFGSRGVGKALAHYEHLRKVVNLTKKKGNGCVAHEWFHALDNYLFVGAGCWGDSMIIADTPAYGLNEKSQLQEAAVNLRDGLQRSGMATRSANIDAYRAKPYWATVTEMAARAFEAYVFYKLEAAGLCNDYLVNFKPANEYDRSECYPYPTREEAAELAPLFDAFLLAAFGESERAPMVEPSAGILPEEDEAPAVAASEPMDAPEDGPTDPTPGNGGEGFGYGDAEKSQLPADMIQRLAAGESAHKEVNAKHPGSVVLFRVADFYASTFGDGERVASVTGATLCTDSNGQAVAYFPFTALDTYLPKLVRAGVKICIADLPAAAPSAPAVAAAEPANDAAAPSYGDAEKSQNFGDVAVSVPEVQEYKLMYLFGGWVCDSCVYAETDDEAIQDATDNYITSRLPRWPYRVALWEGSRLVHEFKGDGPDDIGRRDMEQEESENAPAYIVHDTAVGPFHLDDCATGSILAAVDRLAKNGQTVNPHPLQLLADGVKIWDSEDSREELARIVRQRLAL